MIPRSEEELKYLNELETLSFVICKRGQSNRYFIIIEQSASKIIPCYLTKKGIVSTFKNEDYFNSYEECVQFIEERYQITGTCLTIPQYKGIDANE